MNIRYSYDTHRVIPVPPGTADDEAGRAWAVTAAESYAARIRAEVDLDAVAVARIAQLVTDLARAATDRRSAALIFLPEPQIAAPLTITYSPERPSRAEQEDFLWPRSCLLRPVHRELATERLGAGSTVAIVQRTQERTFAERRWLFLGAESSIAAVVGPVPVPLLSLVEPLADAIIDSLSVDDYVPDAAALGARDIAQAFARDEERWAV